MPAQRLPKAGSHIVHPIFKIGEESCDRTREIFSQIAECAFDSKAMRFVRVPSIVIHFGDLDADVSFDEAGNLLQSLRQLRSRVLRLRLLEKAWQQKPYLIEACQSLVRIAALEQSVDEVIHWCSVGLESDKGYLPFLETRAEAWCWHAERAGGSKEAEASYRNAITDMGRMIEFETENYDAWNTRGWARMEFVDYLANRDRGFDSQIQLAIKDFSEAIDIDPDRQEAWADRASAWLTWAEYKGEQDDEPIDELKNAISDLKQCLKIDPDNEEAEGMLIEATELLNEFE